MLSHLVAAQTHLNVGSFVCLKFICYWR